jgi:hypothetical protein
MRNVTLMIKKQVVFKPAKHAAGPKSDKNLSSVTLVPTTEVVGL